MSRVAKNPLTIPPGIEINISDNLVTVKGSKSELRQQLPAAVNIVKKENKLTFIPIAEMENAEALAGTARALVNSMILGLNQGFERKLTLIGVGYRAQVQGKKLSLSLGYSRTIEYILPDGISVEAPSQTEIVIKGADKHLVGQVAAEIRAFRPPEPYKGKGVRYQDEQVVRKEGKKK